MSSQRPMPLRFDAPLRRRGRQLGRLVKSAFTPSMYPAAPVAHAFWFDGVANFGDALTPWLLHRAGVIPVLTPASRADLVGVGSILEMLPPDYAGMVWGSGLLLGSPVDLPSASFLAVRGPLTRELTSAPSTTPLGDPGILVSRFMRRPPTKWRVGIVPHHLHKSDPLWPRLTSAGPDIRVIDTSRSPTAVLHDIASCQLIVSTSLHGLITADAFGIPAVWTRRQPDLWGGQFKFEDYEAAITPGRSRFVLFETLRDFETSLPRDQMVDASIVQMRQNDLLRVLRRASLQRHLPATVPFRALTRSSHQVSVNGPSKEKSR